MGKYKDLSGGRYGKLTVLSFAGTDSTRNATFLCRCDCGTEKVIAGRSLSYGQTTSCGCVQRKTAAATCRRVRTRHGLSRTRTHNVWVNMRDRCENHNNPAYPRYGGSGIRVCDRWQSFDLFLADMGQCPDGMSIDRYPNPDGNYEPGNCRWATPTQQSRNRPRFVRLVTIRGKTKCVSEWAQEFGIDPRRVHTRICRGWDLERALTTPIRK